MYWRKEALSDLKKVQSLEIFSSKITLSKEKRSLNSDFFFFKLSITIEYPSACTPFSKKRYYFIKFVITLQTFTKPRYG